MTLATLPDGKYIEEKKSEVPPANEKNIGLNYEQFIRSILLSQGEFAKFLKSSENERATLLEDITGSKIYRSIGKAAFEKAKMLKGELTLLKQEMAFMSTLSPEMLTSKQKEITQNRSLAEGLDSSLKEKTVFLQDCEKRIILKSKIEAITADKAKLENRKNIFHPYESKLAKHQALDVHRGELTLLYSEEARLLDTEKELERLQQNIATQEIALSKALKDMAVFTHADITETNFMSEMAKFQSKIIQFDNDIKNYKQDGDQLRTKLLKSFEKGEKIVINEIKEKPTTKEKLVFIGTKLETLDQRPNKNSFHQNELSDQINALQSKIEVLTLKQRELKRSEDISQEITVIDAEISSLNANTPIIKNQLESIFADIQVIEVEISKLQKDKDQKIKMANLEEHRLNLQEDEACPLCGSVHHPYIIDRTLMELGNVELTLQQKLAIQKELTQNQEKYVTQLATISAKTETLQSQLLLKKESIKKIVSEWQEPENMVSSQDVFETLAVHKRSLKDLNEEREVRALIETLDEIRQTLQEMVTIGNLIINVENERNRLYTGLPNQVNTDADLIQNRFTTAHGIMKELTTTYKNVSETKQKLSQSIKERLEKLMPNLRQLGYLEIEDVHKDILPDNTLQRIKKEKQDLSITETEILTTEQNLKKELDDMGAFDDQKIDIDALKSEINILNTQKDQLNNAIGALEKEIEKDAEAKAKVEEINQKYVQKEKEAQPWFMVEHLIGDSTGNKYAKFAQNLSLKQMILLTNVRLAKLSDRYLLELTDIEADLRIRDLYQGNTTRSVKTLSGGESFIVSLALSLSLSDMASQNVRLESLFIDEGFGTLDADTLETALATLERLQSESNRIIGIISHVDALKERISTQVQVVKNNIGYSTIEIVG